MPVIICPPFKKQITSFTYFDDTYWTASPGYWNVDHWEKNYPDDRIIITELGVWNVDFRPASVDITVDMAGGYNGSNVVLDVYDTNNAAIGSITILTSEGTGILVKNLPLTFSTFDISYIVMSGDPYPDFKITNIVFNP